MSYNSATHQYAQQQGGPGSPAISSPSLASGMASFPSAGYAAGMGPGQNQPQTPGQQHEVIPTSFDEATLRALCDTDVGLPLLYERIKQSMTSCREASAFFKKRAAIEEEYGRSLQKLYKGSLESYGTAEAKAGSYVSSWHTILATHEPLADGRIRFAQKLAEMSEELNNLVKEVDRNRKTARDTGVRLERGLLDAEASVEKVSPQGGTGASTHGQIIELTLSCLEPASPAARPESASTRPPRSWSGCCSSSPESRQKAASLLPLTQLPAHPAPLAKSPTRAGHWARR